MPFEETMKGMQGRLHSGLAMHPFGNLLCNEHTESSKLMVPFSNINIPLTKEVSRSFDVGHPDWYSSSVKEHGSLRVAPPLSRRVQPMRVNAIANIPSRMCK